MHEAGHAVVARLVGVQVVSAIADGAKGVVRTRWRVGSTTVEKMTALEKLILIDLAGAAAEIACLGDTTETSWRVDRENAMSRALRIVVLRRGLKHEELTDDLQREAARLIDALCAKAAELIETNLAAIERTAGALAEGNTLGQADIDALMQDWTVDDQARATDLPYLKKRS